MGQITIDMLDDSAIPKRGDLVQTNVGDRRERTWLVLSSRPVRQRKGVPRAKVWIERWWELEPSFRQRLYRSAERAGGQRVIRFRRYPAKKRKLSFEDYMASRSRIERA